MAIEDEQFGPGLEPIGLGTAEEGRRERRMLWVTPEQQQGADVVAAEHRTNQVSDQVSRPDEIALEVRETELSFIRLFDKADQLSLIRHDFHVMIPVLGTLVRQRADSSTLSGRHLQKTRLGRRVPAGLFVLGLASKAGESLRPRRRHASRRQVVAEVLQDDPLLGPLAGQFDQGLEQLQKQGVLAEAPGIEVVVHLGYIAGLPEVHQAMNLVDQRRGPAFFVVAHRLPFALVPGT